MLVFGEGGQREVVAAGLLASPPYLHVLEPVAGPTAQPGPRVTPALRRAFNGALIANGGYTAESGNAAIAGGEADLVAYGAAFLANPDLPDRFRQGAPLNPPDRATFYGGGAQGYTHDPTLEEPAAR